MVRIITESSKYIMILLLIIYTWYSFSALKARKEKRQRRIYRSQAVCMLLVHLMANLVIFVQTREISSVIFYLLQLIFIIFLFIVYKLVYKRAAPLVVNHMCMLMLVGFIMLTRLDAGYAMRQFEIAVIAAVISIFIPALIRRLKVLRRFTWGYGIIGVVALAAVLMSGQITGGANLSYTVAGITLQPSEFIKIIFVFFVACMLDKSINFKRICITTIVAAIHVIILVLSTDLGAALIFFITYVIMLWAATRKPAYLAGGLAVGVLAAAAAARIFSHVKVRVQAWLNPFDSIYEGGWQAAQALFAIGTGGWFGLGLYQGMPDTIPLGHSDFIFAAICEELGGVFGICLIIICFSCFMMFLNIAMQIRDSFYKMIALGLGCVYGIQVFLNIGGVIKCIPSTGLTLPLVSYGGSSIFCTIIIFAIIQGLYIMRQDKGGVHEYPKAEAGQEGAGTGARGGDHRSGRYGERQREPQADEYGESPKEREPEIYGAGWEVIKPDELDGEGGYPQADAGSDRRDNLEWEESEEGDEWDYPEWSDEEDERDYAKKSGDGAGRRTAGSGDDEDEEIW